MKLINYLALILLAACSNEIRVYSDHDPDYNLWSYKTFDWSEKTNIEEGKNPLYYNELNDKRIKSAVREQLESRGFRLSLQNPDILVHYHIIVEDQSVIYTDPFGYYGPYWTRMQTNVYAYREGSLIIDLMDAKTNNLIWRGWAESALEEIYGRDDIDRLVNNSVEKIFRKFPKPTLDETASRM